MEYQVVDCPLDTRRARNSKYDSLLVELKKLPEGKALKVSDEALNANSLCFSIRVRLNGNKKLHTRRLPDGLYLWLTDRS